MERAKGLHEIRNMRFEEPYERDSRRGTSVFIIPGRKVENGDDRVVILNQVARAVIESVRGEHAQFVFVRRGRPIRTMHNAAWQSARRRAGLSQVRVHELKHTRARRRAYRTFTYAPAR